MRTLAPAAKWNTAVRLLLVLTAQLGPPTKQVDHIAAFVHADIDKPPNHSEMTPDEQARVGIFVEMPRGFAKPGYVCKLNKSLCRLKQAPQLWFHHLRDNLLKVGFTQMVDVDSCLFISAKAILSG